MPRNTIVGKKLRVAKRIVRELKSQLGEDLLAVGVCGSVARGTAERYSDIDHLIIIKRPHPEMPLYKILENTYCSLFYETPQSIDAQLHSANHELSEILGGLTKILPLYDPRKILLKIEAEAQRIPVGIFHKSAELALLHSYEDFCRTKNAYLAGDEIVLKDNVYAVTGSAANIVAALNQRYFVSDREIFKAHRSFRKLPRDYDRIELLRYGGLGGEKLFQTFLSFYLDLVHFCTKEGLKFPVSDAFLQSL